MITEKRIELEHEYTLGGRIVTELTMRKPKVNDRLDAAKMLNPMATQADAEASLFGILCGVSREDVGELWDEDYDQLQEAYLFLKVQRPERKTSPDAKTSDGKGLETK